MTEESDYLKYRGKCRQMSEELCANDPSLRLVRGYYTCHVWRSREPHWWCERIDDHGEPKIVDPTKDQFPSRGTGLYEEFDGYFECAECGERIKEEDADIEGKYAFCSYTCHGRFVGVF